MKIKQEVRCNVCNNQMQYLNHELTVISIQKEGDTIGISPKLQVCNVRFYCEHCRVNMSKPFPYQDENVVPLFIADLKQNSAKFDTQGYVTL
jgi:hypothetical protein